MSNIITMKRFFARRNTKSLNSPASSEKKKFGKIFAEKTKEYIESGARKMGVEAKETKEMAQSFFKLLENKLDMKNRTSPPSEEEVREAIEQLKDVGRLSIFTTAIILPAGAISLLGVEMLARKFGINFTFVPSSFRKNADWKHPRNVRKRGKSFQKRRKADISDIKPLDED